MNNLERAGGVTCIQHRKPTSWGYWHVFTTPFNLCKYAIKAHSKYESAYLLIMMTVQYHIPCCWLCIWQPTVYLIFILWRMQGNVYHISCCASCMEAHNCTHALSVCTRCTMCTSCSRCVSLLGARAASHHWPESESISSLHSGTYAETAGGTASTLLENCSQYPEETWQFTDQVFSVRFLDLQGNIIKCVCLLQRDNDNYHNQSNII